MRDQMHKKVKEYVLDQLQKGKGLILSKIIDGCRVPKATEGDVKQLFDEEFKALMKKVEEF